MGQQFKSVSMSVTKVSSRRWYPLDIVRVRDFLKIPYLYTPDDTFDASDPGTYYNHPDYVEDRKVDDELLIVAGQAADLIAEQTGLHIGDTKISYRFTDDCVRIYPSPVFLIQSIFVDGVQITGDEEGHVESFTMDENGYLDVSRFGKYDTLDIDVWVGFHTALNVEYRKGNTFDHYVDTSGVHQLTKFTKAEGVPYTARFTEFYIPDVARRLWEILIDHFYMNRGVVQIGTIVAKMPTSKDVLTENVRTLTPIRVGRTIPYDSTFIHDDE